MSLKNSNDTIGNRTRDLPVCSVVQGIYNYTPETNHVSRACSVVSVLYL